MAHFKPESLSSTNSDLHAGPMASDAEQELERIVGRFEDQWAAGQEPAIENYLSDALLVDRDELLVELIHVDLDRRLMTGKVVQLEDYQHRFPSLANRADLLEELRSKLAARSVVETQGLREDTEPARDPSTLDVQLPELPGFEVLRELGRGGMGTVYEAWQPSLQRHVAIKMVESDRRYAAELAARLENEARSVAALQHPHIVAVYEVGEYRGRPYLVMEHLPGGTLQDRIARGALDPREAAELVLQLAGAMQRAHAARLVHRDLKPANVLFAADGTPKISDFGLARNLAEDVGLTRSGDIVGTPCYMAPEQATSNAKVGPAADVFALGGVLYSAMTAARPFHGVSVHDVLGQVEKEPPIAPRKLVPAIPRDLETVCLKCLEKDPAQRYSGMEMLAADLQRFLSGQTVLARRAGPLLRLHRWTRRNPALAALSVVVILGAAAMLGGSIAYSVQLSDALQIAEQRRSEAEQSQLAALQARDNEQLAREEAVQSSLRAQTAEQQATLDAARARDEAAAADRTADFLVSLFRSGDAAGINPLGMLSSPDAVGSTIDVADLLARGHERISTELADYPRARAKLLITLGSVAASRADIATAEATLLEAIELIETELPNDTELLATALYEQGTLYLQRWDFKPAIDPLQRALEIREQHLDETSLDLLKARFMLGLAQTLNSRGTGAGIDLLISVLQSRDKIPNSPETEHFFELAKALALVGELARPGDGGDQLKRLQSVSRILDRHEVNGLARVFMKVFRAQGALEKLEYQKAIETYDEVLRDVEELFGGTDSTLAMLAEMGHASLLQSLGDYLQWKPLIQRITAWADRHAPLHEQLVLARTELVHLLALEGDHAACEHHALMLQRARVALGHQIAVAGADGDPYYAWCSGNYDTLLANARWEFEYHTKFAINRPDRGAALAVLRSAHHLVELLVDHGKLDEAGAVLERADRAIEHAFHKVTDNEYLREWMVPTRLLVAQEQASSDIPAILWEYVEALPRAALTNHGLNAGRNAINFAVEVVPAHSAYPPRWYNSTHAQLGLALGVPEGTLRRSTYTLAQRNNKSTYDQHPVFARAHVLRGKALAALHRDVQADIEWQDGLANYRKNLGSDHMTVCVYDSDYAVWLASQNRLNEADELSRDALQRALRKAPQGHPWSELVLANRAQVLAAFGQQEQALPLHQQRCEFISRFSGPHSRAQALAIVDMARCLEQLARTDDAVALLETHHDELAALVPERNWRLALLDHELARLQMPQSPDDQQSHRARMATASEIVQAAWGPSHVITRLVVKP